MVFYEWWHEGLESFEITGMIATSTRIHKVSLLSCSSLLIPHGFTKSPCRICNHQNVFKMSKLNANFRLIIICIKQNTSSTVNNVSLGLTLGSSPLHFWETVSLFCVLDIYRLDSAFVFPLLLVPRINLINSERNWHSGPL